jgi:hypothetical protein
LLAVAVLAAATILALGGTQAAADPDSNHGASGVTSPLILGLIGNDDVFATTNLVALLDPMGVDHTQHYGPYPSGSPDSGTCANDWATDTFDRDFTVHSNHDGTYTVVQQFKNGSFITNAGPSPGSCDLTDGSPPGFVDQGITGSMHGYFIISTGPFGQSSNDASCVAGSPSTPCTTAGFINSHFFGCDYPERPCSVTTFFAHYAAGDQGLAEHEWKNASEDRGGNHGDIRSTEP